LIGARAMGSLTGREYLQAMIDGQLPPAPIAGLVAMTDVWMGEGTVEFRCLADESAYHPIGVVHGGPSCMLLDYMAGCAVHRTPPAGVGYTSLEIKVSHLRPVRHGEVPRWTMAISAARRLRPARRGPGVVDGGGSARSW
jgi:uncharacterized protein (TIGR00369 family)